jgi:hypothetical protein
MNTAITPHRQEGTTTTAHRAEPRSMSYFDGFYRLRKGTAMRAARNRQLKAVFRRGRGGMQAWAFPEDGDDWFNRGLLTEPGETKP